MGKRPATLYALQHLGSLFLGVKDQKKLDTDPEGIVRDWYTNAKAEVDHQPGEVFNPRVYGNLTIRDKFPQHTTLWWMWLIGRFVAGFCGRG